MPKADKSGAPSLQGEVIGSTKLSNPSSLRVKRKKLTLLALLWIAFVIRGSFYAAVLPIWEGYDEPYHFAYLQYLVAKHTPPTLATPVSRQIDASLHVLPLPWMLSLQAIPKPLYTHEKYWNLVPAEREFLQKQFKELPSQWSREPSPEVFQNYEAQQPPLYYLLCWPLLLVLKNQSLAAQVLGVRIAGIVLASLAIPLGFVLIQRVTESATVAARIISLVIVMPELYINLARVSNEALSIVLYSALLYGLVRFPQQLPKVWTMLLGGIALGLGLLTKAYFLTAIPAFFLIAIFFVSRHPQHYRRILVSCLTAGMLCVVIAGPWYFRVHRETGSWSGLQPATLVHHSALGVIASIPRVNWRSGVLSIVISHIWFGAWSFLRLPRLWYIGFGIVYLLALAGLVRLGLRLRSHSAGVMLSADAFFVLICFYAFFCLGLAYDILLLFVSVGASSSTGWYMYCLVLGEAMLLYFGLQALLPAHRFRWVLPLLTSSFALLDLYGNHFVLMPYYAGIIGHNSGGQVDPASLRSVTALGMGTLLQRLTVNKPAFVNKTAFLVLWLLYIIATILVVSLSWRLRPSGSEVER
jgi:hypothetical protein